MSRRATQQAEAPKITIVEGSFASSYLVPAKRRLPHPVILVCGVIVSGFIFSLAGWVFLPYAPWMAPKATIVLHPETLVKSRVIQVAFTVIPRTATQASPRLSVRATGIVRETATAAHGMLTFYNPAGFAQTVVGGTTIDQAGLQVMTDQSVSIPAGTPSSANSATVAAHVLQTGSQGNIAPLTIDGLCTGCSGTDLAVKNLAAFWGGQDAVQYMTVRAADVSGVTRAQEPLLEVQSRDGLREHIRAGEQLGAPVACAQQARSDPAAGARAVQVLVQVTVTCTALVYSPADAQQRAATLFQFGIERTLDRHLILIQPVTARIQLPVVEHTPDTLFVSVLVEGHWLYHMSAGEQASLIRHLAGLPRKQALTTLLGIPGIRGAIIEGIQGNDSLPADPGQFTLRIV